VPQRRVPGGWVLTLPPAGLVFGVRGRQVGDDFRLAHQRQAGESTHTPAAATSAAAAAATSAAAAAAVTTAAADATAAADGGYRRHLASG